MNISHASLVEWGLSHIKLRKDMIILDVAGFSEIDIYEQKEKGWITVIAMKQEV